METSIARTSRTFVTRIAIDRCLRSIPRWTAQERDREPFHDALDRLVERPHRQLRRDRGHLDGDVVHVVPGQEGPYDDWETDWTHLTGWKRWLMVSGTVHGSFTDLGVLADQLGVDIGASIDGARALTITRNYVSAFFDRNLRCRPEPLLAAPSPAYPEVTFIG